MWSQPCKRATYYTTVHRMAFSRVYGSSTLLPGTYCPLPRVFTLSQEKTLCSKQRGVSLHGNIVHVVKCSATRYNTGMVFHGNVHGRYYDCPYGISMNIQLKVHTLAQDVTSWSSWDATITPQLFKTKSKIHVNNLYTIVQCAVM